jgi:hypothetical protein
MPNDTLAANAAAMPTRRAVLVSLAATGALLIAPQAASAANSDADIYAQVERVRATHSQLLATAAADYIDEEAEEAAFDDAVDELAAEQEALLAIIPHSVGALKAVAAVLLETDAFGLETVAPALARAIIATPFPGKGA